MIYGIKSIKRPTGSILKRTSLHSSIFELSDPRLNTWSLAIVMLRADEWLAFFVRLTDSRSLRGTFYLFEWKTRTEWQSDNRLTSEKGSEILSLLFCHWNTSICVIHTLYNFQKWACRLGSGWSPGTSRLYRNARSDWVEEFFLTRVALVEVPEDHPLINLRAHFRKFYQVQIRLDINKETNREN